MTSPDLARAMWQAGLEGYDLARAMCQAGLEGYDRSTWSTERGR